MLLYDAIDEYIRLHLSRQRRPRKVSSALRHHLPLLQNKPMEAVTRFDIVEWQAKIGQTAPASANKALTLVRHCYNLMADWGKYTGPNPCERIKKLPRPKRKRVVQSHEMPTLLKAIEKDQQLGAQIAILIALYTGLRKMEICGIQWQHFDMVTGQGIYPSAKGGKPYKFWLPPDVLARLKRLQHGDGPHVFQTRTGKPWSGSTVDEAWWRIRARAGLDDVHFHDLRRTYCSWLQMLGAPMDALRDMMNHSSMQMTEIYTDGIDLSGQHGRYLEALAQHIQAHRTMSLPPSAPPASTPPATQPPPPKPADPVEPAPSTQAWHYGGREGSA